MLCQHCHKREASETVAWSNDEGSKELSVCAECAAALNGLQAGFSKITGLFLQMIAGVAPSPPLQAKEGAASPPSADGACPVCGMTRATLQETHRFGCPACYDAFPQEVEALLSEMQYGDIHIGNTPGDRALYGQIKTMRKRLKEAVKENDFTLAAQLRDRIHAMEATGNKH